MESPVRCSLHDAPTASTEAFGAALQRGLGRERELAVASEDLAEQIQAGVEEREREVLRLTRERTDAYVAEATVAAHAKKGRRRRTARS